MGYSVLYIAFGIVALWLLGEVLLQYKARLRWRVLAFAGFMCVVAGVATRQVAVIVLGALAFGAGQSFVTLSYKRGFSTGWALGGRPGSSRRRRGGAPRAAEPVLEVTPVEPEFDAAMPGGEEVLAGEPGRPGQDGQVYQPVPMHDDSGEYPLFDGPPAYTPDPYTSSGYEGYGAQGYAGWGAEPQPAAAGYDGGYQGGYDQSGGGWGGQEHGYDQAAAHQQPQRSAAPSYDGYVGAYDSYAGDDGYGRQAAAHAGGGSGDWTPAYDGQQPPGADPYTAYGYDPQAQPYIPQQQTEPGYQPQPPYQQHQHQEQYQEQQYQDREQDQRQYEQRPPAGQPQQQAAAQQPQQQYAGEYADPYDPYRY